MQKDHPLIQSLLDTAKQHGDRTALWVEEEHYSYSQLIQHAKAMASVMTEAKSDYCIIITDKNYLRFVAIWASLLADKIFVPVCPKSPEHLISAIFEQLNSDLYVVGLTSEKEQQHVAAYIPEKAYVLNNDIVENAANHAQMQVRRSNPVAYVMFTSGSTGKPKGVQVSLDNLHAYLDGAVTLFEPTCEDRIAQMNTHTFDLSVHDMFLGWYVGAAVYGLPDNNLFAVPQLVREHLLTFWLSVPTTGVSMANLGQLKPDAMPSMRYTLFCGEAMPNSLAGNWHKACPNSRIFNVYGPTEATIAITWFEWFEGKEYPEIVPIGYPYPGQDAIVLNEDLQEVESGGEGELYLGGNQVTPGYLNNEQQNRLRFVTLPGRTGTWFRTGDIAQRSDEHGLLYKGRSDDQYQIRGYRIERLEIEILLRKAAGVDSVAIVPWPRVEGGLYQGLVAFVQDSELESFDIRKRCQALMPDYMWPSKIICQQLPLNRSKKVDYVKLNKQLAGE